MLNVKRIKYILGVLSLCLLIFCVCACIYIYFIYYEETNQEKIALNYKEARIQIAQSDKYIAISTLNGIIIKDYNGNKISKLNLSEFGVEYPDQIALGEKSCFLLYKSQTIESVDSKSLIVKISYDLKRVEKEYYENIQHISCKEGVLFLINEKVKYTDNSTRSISGLYANCYVQEKNFGKKLIKLKANKNGKCEINGLVLYPHSKTLFSIQPLIEDYSGGLYITITNQTNLNEILDKKREILNCMSVLDVIDLKEGQVCQLYEYQESKNIYGICNILEYSYLDPPEIYR